MNWKLIDAVAELAVEAGNAILEIYNSDDLGVSQKTDGSPLTAADMAAHRLLGAGLQALEPDTPVLSEESAAVDAEVRNLWQRYWLVDPLDGTAEFVNKNGEFTVNVALIENHRPIMGVVHAPVQGVTYLGSASLGAYRRDDQGQQAIKARSVASVVDVNQPLVLMVSRRHGDTKVNQLVEKINRQLGGCSVKNVGSSLKICMMQIFIPGWRPPVNGIPLPLRLCSRQLEVQLST
jgi:3'(2'), 5'-bisphosphate nucleotidase